VIVLYVLYILQFAISFPFLVRRPVHLHNTTVGIIITNCIILLVGCVDIGVGDIQYNTYCKNGA
jgi:hypothetical protein